MATGTADRAACADVGQCVEASMRGAGYMHRRGERSNMHGEPKASLAGDRAVMIELGTFVKTCRPWIVGPDRALLRQGASRVAARTAQQEIPKGKVA